MYSIREGTFAIMDDNTLKSWGARNGHDALGRNARGTSPATVNLGSGKSAKQIDESGHTCAVLNDDTLKCWGSNGKGQLGLGDTSYRGTPPASTVNLGNNRTVRMVAAGGSHTCAILDNYTVKCWGEHANGSLGAGAGTIVWGDGDGVDDEGQSVSEMGENLPVVELL